MVFGPKKICRTIEGRRRRKARQDYCGHGREPVARDPADPRGRRGHCDPPIRPPKEQPGHGGARCTAAGTTSAVPVTGNPDRARCRRCGIPKVVQEGLEEFRHRDVRDER